MKHNVYISAERKGYGVMLPTAALILGITVGAWLGAMGNVPDNMGKNICPIIYGGTPLEIFRCTFISSALYLAAAFLAGLSAPGQPAAILLPALKGAELGTAAALIYAKNGITALPGMMVIVMPVFMGMILVALTAAREILRTSGALLRIITKNDVEDVPSLKLCCLKYTILTAAALFISALSALLYYFFGGLI